MKILIVGASGLVGSVATTELEKKYKVLKPPSSELDINKIDDVRKWINAKPKWIVLLSAFTDVEAAQKDNSMAMKVNANGAKNVFEVAHKNNIPVIFISTDFVFEGTKENSGPNSSNSKTAKKDSKLIGEYARSKLLGEIEFKNSGVNGSIIRISYPFGNSNSEKDFAKKTLKLIENGYPLFNDQQFTPTYIPDLVKAIEQVIDQDLNGVFHVACKNLTTPYEFGKYLVDKLGLKLEVKAGSLEEFMKGRTQKPLLGGLVPSEEFELHTWQEAIDDFSSTF